MNMPFLNCYYFHYFHYSDLLNNKPVSWTTNQFLVLVSCNLLQHIPSLSAIADESTIANNVTFYGYYCIGMRVTCVMSLNQCVCCDGHRQRAALCRMWCMFFLGSSSNPKICVHLDPWLVQVLLSKAAASYHGIGQLFVAVWIFWSIWRHGVERGRTGHRVFSHREQ